MDEKIKGSVREQNRITKTLSYFKLSIKVIFYQRTRFLFLWLAALFLPSITEVLETVLWSSTVNRVVDIIGGAEYTPAILMIFCTLFIRIGNEGFSILKYRAFDKLARESDRKMTMYAMERTANIKQENFDIGIRYDKVKGALTSQLSLWNLNWQMTVFASSSLTIFLSMIITMPYNTILTLLVIPFAVTSFIINLRSTQIDRELIITERKNESAISYYASLILKPVSVKELMLFGETDNILDDWEKNICKSQKDKNRIELKRQSVSLLELILEALFTLLVYFTIAMDTYRGTILAGDFYLYTANFLLVYGAVKECCEAMRESINMSDDYDVFLNFTMATEEGEREGKKMPDVDKVSVSFDNVSFAYEDTEVLHSISFQLNAGEKVVLLGPNGSGKSTLVKVICGLYDSYQGDIYINGENIRQYSQDEIYKMIGIVYQDFCHYQMKLREVVAAQNIEKQNEDERINYVLACCGLNEMTSVLKNGFDTVLGREFEEDGIELSGGQWQKIAIARNYFGDRPIYIFDESASALDTIAENMFLDNVLKENENKTVIMISHRMSVGKIADRILYMRDGKIAEQGTHAELMAVGGAYAKAYSAQAKLFREEDCMV